MIHEVDLLPQISKKPDLAISIISPPLPSPTSIDLDSDLDLFSNPTKEIKKKGGTMSSTIDSLLPSNSLFYLVVVLF